MPRVGQKTNYVNFAKGFITEATGLTFPENSVQDIDNCDIELKGSIRRRLGLSEERGGFTVGVWDDLFGVDKRDLAITVHVWDFANNEAERRYAVFQIGNNLYFRNRTNQPVSAPDVLGIGINPILDISGFAYGTVANAAQKPLQSASGLGRIFFTGEGHKPFYVQYDPVANTFVTELVGKEVGGTVSRLGIRDFTGIDDSLAADTQPTVLTKEHLYNLLNQGWLSDKINSYFTSQSKYPSNSQQWILGKNSTDDFDPALLAKQDFGNSRAPRGRFIIDPLTGDRDGRTHTVTGITSPIDFSNQYDEVATTSFKAVCFFSGRVFFAGEQNTKRANAVYFSKTVQTVSDAGVFHQEQDPTSEHFSDLLDTDGGVLPIPEADGIERLIPFNNGVLVLARNGVWFIRGSDAGFTATNIAVDKISNTGIIAQGSVIQADSLVMFFADNGIHAVTDNQGFPVVQDTTQTTIFTFYNKIPLEARRRVVSGYDAIGKRCYWLYYDDNSGTYSLDINVYNRMLVFDIRTGAYTKHSFEVSTEDTTVFALVGLLPSLSPSVPQLIDGVSIGGDPVVVGTDSVVVQLDTDEVPDTLVNNINVIILSESTLSLRICTFNGLQFFDYPTMTTPFGIPSVYVSRVLTKPETLGSLDNYKQATYVNSFFKKTETKFVKDQDTGELVADRPSGCTLRGTWDWNVTDTGNRWSDPQQAYRFRKGLAAGAEGDPIDNGEGICYTKLKVRGKGKALALLYESVEGKDFVLLGYSVPMTANGV